DPVPPLPRGDQRADGRVEEDATEDEHVLADSAVAALEACIHAAPDERERAGARPDPPGEAPLGHGAATGTRPATVVPSPGADRTLSSPPSAARRSDIPWSPEPREAVAGS